MALNAIIKRGCYLGTFQQDVYSDNVSVLIFSDILSDPLINSGNPIL